MRVVLTGGGTGGHIYPALAIGRMIMQKEPDSSLLYIGTRKGMEARIVPGEGIPFEEIDITGFRRSLSLDNVRTVVRFLQGVQRSKKLLREFKPDAIIGTGGYVCGPVVYAASRLGIPALIHEQNAIPGLTNKFLSKYVDGVAVSFAESAPYFTRCSNVEHTGNPCASAVAAANRQQGFAALGLTPGTPFVLVVGGSSGAKALNDSIAALASRLSELERVHLVFATGERFYEETRQRLAQLKVSAADRLHVLPYIRQMPDVLSAASLCVSRAGASTLAELTALGVPAILIPSPNVTNNHQEANARALSDVGAAEMIVERDLTGDLLFRHIRALMVDREQRDRMREASLRLGRPEAAELLYNQLTGIVKYHRSH